MTANKKNAYYYYYYYYRVQVGKENFSPFSEKKNYLFGLD